MFEILEGLLRSNLSFIRNAKNWATSCHHKCDEMIAQVLAVV